MPIQTCKKFFDFHDECQSNIRKIHKPPPVSSWRTRHACLVALNIVRAHFSAPATSRQEKICTRKPSGESPSQSSSRSTIRICSNAVCHAKPSNSISKCSAVFSCGVFLQPVSSFVTSSLMISCDS